MISRSVGHFGVVGCNRRRSFPSSTGPPLLADGRSEFRKQ